MMGGVDGQTHGGRSGPDDCIAVSQPLPLAESGCGSQEMAPAPDGEPLSRRRAPPARLRPGTPSRDCAKDRTDQRLDAGRAAAGILMGILYAIKVETRVGCRLPASIFSV